MAKPKDFSEETSRIIDEEIQKIVNGQEKKASEIISQNKKKLDMIARALLEKETLENEDIESILKKKPRPKRKNMKRKRTNSKKAGEDG